MTSLPDILVETIIGFGFLVCLLAVVKLMVRLAHALGIWTIFVPGGLFLCYVTGHILLELVGAPK